VKNRSGPATVIETKFNAFASGVRHHPDGFSGKNKIFTVAILPCKIPKKPSGHGFSRKRGRDVAACEDGALRIWRAPFFVIVQTVYAALD
jgi:hypothetical protein